MTTLVGQNWSNPLTWGGTVPISGDVTISGGKTVILDILASPNLGCIIIEKNSSLIISPIGSVGLPGVECIQVFGSFLGGEYGSPLTNSITIEYNGIDPIWPEHSKIPHINDNSDPMYRSLMTMPGGTTRLISKYPKYPRMFLGDHALAGTNVIITEKPSLWNIGDEIVISPSGFFNMAQRSEKRKILDISYNKITIDKPITYSRWGKLQYPIDVPYGTNSVSNKWGVWSKGHPGMPSSIDERAVVINVTRNFNMSGVNDVNWSANLSGTPTRTAADGQGMHTMCMAGGKAYFEGIKTIRCGQSGRIGRYPFHWHMQSYVPAKYDIATEKYIGGGTRTNNNTLGQGVKGCVVESSANRAYVTHGTDNIINIDSIAYNVDGWAFIFEDGSEQNNKWIRPTALMINSPGKINLIKGFDLYDKDTGNEAAVGIGPGGFWVTNMNNSVIDPLAADCMGKGLHNALNDRCLGQSTNVPLKPAYIHPGNNIHTGYKIFSNAQENIRTGGAAVDELGTVGLMMYQPTDNQEHPNVGGNRLRFTISNVSNHHSGGLGYQNAVGQSNYLNWCSSSHPHLHAIGSAWDAQFTGCLFVGYTNHFDTWLGKGNSANTGNAPIGAWTDTMHALASYHRTGYPVNTTFVNFPYGGREKSLPVPGTRIIDQGLWMGCGAMRTHDLYLEPLQQGLVRSPGLQFSNAHPGFRSQDASVDRRPFVPPENDHRAWNISAAEWDPYGYWSTPGHYIMQDDPFMNYGASSLTPVTPLNDHQGFSTPDHVYGIVLNTWDNELCRYVDGSLVTSKDTATTVEPITYELLDSNDVVRGTWYSRSAIGIYSRVNFRHAGLRVNQKYRIRYNNFPALSIWLGATLTNFWRPTDNLIIGFGWSGKVPARVMFTNGPGSPTSNPENIALYYIPKNLAAAADTGIYSSSYVNDKATLESATGRPLTMWQDTVNDIVWVKVIGGLLSQHQFTTNAIATNPTGNEALWKFHTITIMPKP